MERLVKDNISNIISKNQIISSVPVSQKIKSKQPIRDNFLYARD